MKNQLNRILAVAALVFGCSSAYPQDINHVCGTDSVRLRAGNFQYGTIQWERSIDNVHWETIPGEKDTVYQFLPEEDMYYRAVSVYSECPAEYSDIAYVQLPPEANAGLDRVTPSASMFLQANLPPSATGTWRIIEGEGSCTISDVYDPYALVQGDYGIYQFEWALSNTCGVSKDTVEVELIQNKFTDDLVIVDDTDVMQSTADQLEEGIYMILFSEPVPDIFTNTYLVGITTEDGFLRKVDAFTRNDNHYICHTSQAALEDIIEEGGFSFDQVFIIDESIFTEKNGITYAGHYAKLDHKPTRKELTTDPKFKENDYFYIVEEDRVYLYPGVELNHPTDKSTKIGLSFNSVIFTANNLNVKLGGHYWFKPNFVADIEVKWFKLRYFKLGLSNATVERQIHLTTTASSAVNISNRNYTLYSVKHNYLFLIGGVPIWIKSEFSIGGKLSASTSGNVNITQGMNETITYNAYIEYKKNWKYVFNEKATTQPVLTSTTKNRLTQALDIGPRLSFTLFGIVGPYLGMGLKQDFNLCFRGDDWNTNMKLSGNVYVGARARIFGKTLFDKSKTWSTGLYRHQFPYGLQIMGGNNQTYEPGKSLAQKVKVKVISDKAFQLPGATVWFTPKDGGSVQNSMVQANASGIAETVWTPGGSQSSRLEARILDCSGKDIKNSPLVFNANANTSGIDCGRSSLAMGIERIGQSIIPKPFLGNPPYTYIANGINYGSLPPMLVASPGTSHSFIIKDNSNCQASDNLSEPVIACDLSDLRLETNVMGSTIEAVGKGGVPPYRYSLNSDTSEFGTGNAFNGLTPGAYTVFVKDTVGCIRSENVNITDIKPPIVADFMADKTSIKPGESVHFENLSNNAMSSVWTFGDGKTSIEPNPTHTYNTAGTFTVSLAVKNTYAGDVKTMQNYITVIPETGSRRQPCPDTPTVTDSDGNVYEAILIGNQCWMAENLKTTTYTDGSPIDYPGGNDIAWENNTTGAYTWYLNEPGNKNTYGALYNWHAVNNSNGLCPLGWHVPSDAEWTQMTNYLIDNHDDITLENVINKLKSCRQIGSPLGGGCNTDVHPRWDASEDTFGTDDFGFAGLPGGICSTNGAFFMVGERGKWWSSTLGPYTFDIKQEIAGKQLTGVSSSADPDMTAWGRTLSVHPGDLFREPIIIENGLSIRCVRSEGQQAVLPSVVTEPVTEITESSAKGGGQVVLDGGAFVSARGVCWSTAPNPTIQSNLGMTTNGSGTGTFYSNLSGLTPGTTYYVRAYATNSVGTAYGEQRTFNSLTAIIEPETGTFIDFRDGQTYKWVKIGNQIWMAENLKYLPSVVKANTGSETTAYYYVVYYNGTDVSEAKATASYQNYGVLYNWPAAMAGSSSSNSNPSGVKGACPAGWHLPSHNEWTELERYVCNTLGNTDCATKFPFDNTTRTVCGINEGNALKSCRQVNSPLGGACSTSNHPRWDAHSYWYGNDSSGFSAHAGGFRYDSGYIGSYLGTEGYWWSTTEYDSTRAFFRNLHHIYGTVLRDTYKKSNGFSIRCLRD